jgi:ABC-type dipeptide/oligopeptide/nickel transport system permease component
VFLILHLIPGDPAQILLFGSSATPEQVAQVRRQLGLEDPLPVQYFRYLGDILQGDLGRSFASNTSINDEIAARFPDTLRLTLAGMGVAIAVGVPLGLVGGVRPNTWRDRLSTGISVLGIAIPYFWFALILILVFAVHLHWLPALGAGSPQAIVLPAIALGWPFAAIITRLLRANLIEVYEQPYMQVARARGLSSRTLLYRHALKNAFIPVITILGLQFGNMLSGAVVIEVVFARAGIGSYLVNSIQAKDIPAVQGIVLLIAVMYLLINLVVDLAYGVLDPRIRLAWSRT